MTAVIDNYGEFFKEYADIFEPMFKAAKGKSEFNLIMSLLAIRGMSDAGWEPFENTVDVADEVHRQQKKFKFNLRLNINLWAYVHMVECSEHFELVANLLRTIKGDDYVVANHKNRKYANLTVLQKIDRIKRVAAGTGFENVAEPFILSFDSRLRNAIGHGDYALKSGQDSGVTIMDDAGYPKLYTQQEVSDIVNRGLALHSAIRRFRNAYISSYDKSTVIKSSPGFGHGTPIDITLIARKGHGVIGFRCIGGYDLGKPFESRLVSCLGYERKAIDDGVNDLPPSRVDKANKVLLKFPLLLRKKVMPFADKYINRELRPK